MVCSSVGQQPRLAVAKTGGSSEGIRHPTTNWLRQSVPRPSKGGQKVFLPHLKAVPLAPLSALRRAQPDAWCFSTLAVGYPLVGGDQAKPGGGLSCGFLIEALLKKSALTRHPQANHPPLPRSPFLFKEGQGTKRHRVETLSSRFSYGKP